MKIDPIRRLLASVFDGVSHDDTPDEIKFQRDRKVSTPVRKLEKLECLQPLAFQVVNLKTRSVRGYDRYVEYRLTPSILTCSIQFEPNQKK